jgi:predicted RNA-binding protein Jag
MTTSEQFEGRTVEEALDAAATRFGVERFQIRYHVLTEKRGFLGGIKKVVIEAEVSDPTASAPVLETPAEFGWNSPSRAGSDGARRRQGGGRGRRPRERRPERERELTPLVDGPPVVIEPAPEQGEESPKAAAARLWVEELCRKAGLELEIRSTESEERVTLHLYGAATVELVSKNGELIDAIQVLANKALAGRVVEKQIELEAGSFKERRVEELQAKARKLADKVRSEGREIVLPAMSPVERRIVHLALHDDADVTTESRGEGFYKRVAIVNRPDVSEP